MFEDDISLVEKSLTYNELTRGLLEKVPSETSEI